MRSPRRQNEDGGISLPELLIASIILIWVVMNSFRMTMNSLSGMDRSKRRSLVDIAIAERIEILREKSFNFLCTQGCSNDELTKALKYDLATLKPLCERKSLGEAFLSNLPTANKPESFPVGLFPPTTVNVTYTAEQNLLHVNYTADTSPEIFISTTLVPHAQGWCP